MIQPSIDRPLGAWMRRGAERGGHPHQAPWSRTLWLTGVDYFSSLGYAPGLAFLAAGYMAPIATMLLIAVTFLAAVPVYTFVAKHSPHGEGSIKMIERLTERWGRLGWLGKTLVLGLIGFAMTDFVITITLSSADATVHLLENPLLRDLFPEHEARAELITGLFILALCVVFLKGFREAIGLAMLIAIPYMGMNAAIIVRGFMELASSPEHVAAWIAKVSAFEIEELRSVLHEIEPPGTRDPLDWVSASGPLGLILVSLVVFPKLALGLSGFETGVSVMPLIAGVDEADRVRNTRKLLIAAATLMSVELMGSSAVTTLLIPVSEYAPGGRANGRALAFLAHELLGETFGTVYDFTTLAILWFAGASAMAGLLNIIPRYLPRFGMSPTWIEYRRPLVLVITGVCLFVSSSFDANVEAQGGAYATGVLVLMSSGAFAVMLAEWSHPGRRVAFAVMLSVFLYVTLMNCIERPDGLRIAGTFVLVIVATSIWSRWRRSSELRVHEYTFVDEASKRLWGELRETNGIVLIPLRSKRPEGRRTALARSLLHLEVEKSKCCFLYIDLTDDPSKFSSPVEIQAREDGGDYVVEVRNAVAVANAIAFVALELHVDEVVIGLLESGTPVVNAVMYLAFGTGEVGYAVRAIFMRLREDRLRTELEMRKSFDGERDKQEHAALRAMILADPSERERLSVQLFEKEAEAFRRIVTSDFKLPRLILVG
ncbi:MAG: hypothetical protein HYV07_20315 [Deltaproteobacteria bacterium]|nr:hypothetical protein [Deltaproteobacteria bacterium]